MHRSSVILSIDPAAKSGYCILVDGIVEVSGEWPINPLVGVTRIQGVVDAAVKHDDLTVVIEDLSGMARGMYHGTVHRIGVAAGQWIFALRAAGVREWAWCPPQKWQREMLGKGKRDALKAASIALASQHVPHDPGDNEADAINLALYHHVCMTNGGEV